MWEDEEHLQERGFPCEMRHGLVEAVNRRLKTTENLVVF